MGWNLFKKKQTYRPSNFDFLKDHGYELELDALFWKIKRDGVVVTELLSILFLNGKRKHHAVTVYERSAYETTKIINLLREKYPDWEINRDIFS